MYSVTHRRSQIELTNMCLVYDDHRILVQEKIVNGKSVGLVFPGGHVEEGESLRDSIIREIKEETGLTIAHPRPCGYKDWIQEDGTRYLVLLYKTNEFTGEIHNSEEGHVMWLDKKDVDKANLVWNMRELLEIFEGSEFSEFFFKIVNGKHGGELLG